MENIFEGIPIRGLEILFEIRIKDSKEFYEDIKPEYRKYMLEPFQKLITQITPAVLEIDPLMQVTPAVGKTISKVRRDTRFSKDKTKYRDTMWFFLRRTGTSWLNAPGFWFEVTQQNFTYGTGAFCALPKVMNKYREIILKDPQKFLNLAKYMDSLENVQIIGESYKKDKPGTEKLPPELKTWYNRKSLFFQVSSQDFDRLQTPDLADDIQSAFTAMAPFYHFSMEVFNSVNADRTRDF